MRFKYALALSLVVSVSFAVAVPSAAAAGPVQALSVPRSAPLPPLPSRVRPGGGDVVDVTRAAGQLDPTFGHGGVVTTDFASSASNQGFSAAVDPDSRVLFAGPVTSADVGRFVVGRTKASGALDTSFGVGGAAVATFDGYDSAWAYVLARQSDGAIVAAGTAETSAGLADFALARFDAQGALDPTFGAGGRVVLDVDPNATDQIFALAVLPDGKILVGGATRLTNGAPTESRLVLARFLANGAPDPTFGTNGWAAYHTTDFGYDQWISGLGVQRDGKIVFVVKTAEETMIVGRALPNGQLDATFGVAGVLHVDLPGSGDRATCLAVRPDDRILVAGSVSSLAGDGSDVAVVQLTASGSLDPAFGAGGFARVDVLTYEGADSCLLLPDGRLVVGGTGSDATAIYEQAIRLDTRGARNANFGVGGFSHVPVSGYGAALGLAAGSDGRVVTCGYDGSLAQYDCLLVRRTPSGALDTTFDGDGVARVDERTSGDDTISKIALAPGGKVVAFGPTKGTQYDPGLSLARYNADGALDATFADHGRLLLTGPAQSTCMAVQPDGKILVGESLTLQNNTFVVRVRRFLPSGILDVRFGSTGVATVLTTRGCCAGPRSVAVAPDGRVVVAGNLYPAGTEDGFVARLTATGVLDRTFASGGVFRIDTGNDEKFTDVFVRADGSVIAAGEGFDFEIQSRVGFVERLSSTGAPVATFGTGGHAEIRVATTNYGLHGWAVQPDGKVLVAGFIYDPVRDATDSYVYRLGADGRPDAGFGSGGLVTIDVSSAEQAGGIAVATDGRLIVVGSSFSQNYVARLTPSGQLDATFAGGLIFVPIAGYLYSAFGSVAVLPDGRIVVGGAAYRVDTGADFALARLLAS